VTSESGDFEFSSFNGPVGLGGWLILPRVGLFLSALQHLSSTFRILGLLKPESWTALTLQGSAVYDPWWAPLLIFELAASVALLMSEILIFYLFWGQRRVVPQLMIAWLIAQVFVAVTDFLLTRQIHSLATEGSVFDLVLRSMVLCLVWIPYFLTSRRVKATFVL
jgi:hypothetical protein